MRRVLVSFCIAAVAALVPLVLTAEEHAAVGADKCAKICHKVQYKSWEASKHAKATPKVECETCHGNGADYKKLKVMKDLEAAKAAGLIIPDKATCTAKCHKAADITDEKFANVHEHKAKK